LGLSVVGIPNHFNGFLCPLLRRVVKGSKSARNRKFERTVFDAEHAPESPLQKNH